MMLLLIYTALVIFFLELPRVLYSSSAAPPACLDGFIVETNGGTGEAYTCTPLHP